MRLSLDNPVLDYMNTVVQFIALNLIYLICCLPVLTIGPATAALYQVTLREARREHGYLIRKFFQHMKEMFFQESSYFSCLPRVFLPPSTRWSSGLRWARPREPPPSRSRCFWQSSSFAP